MRTSPSPSWFVIPLTALALALAAGACGSDNGDPIADARASDAATTDGTSDAQVMTACETFCSCMVATCDGETESCLAECEMLAASTLTCRMDHCAFAQVTDPLFHCPHARGEEDAPGTPAACIDD